MPLDGKATLPGKQAAEMMLRVHLEHGDCP